MIERTVIYYGGKKNHKGICKRGIVELVLRSGSLDDRFISRGMPWKRTKAHIKLQKDNEKIYENYQKEIKLQKRFHHKLI